MQNDDQKRNHDPVLMEKIATRVRVLRTGRGWSQEVMAELSGLHRNYIGYIERSEVNVSLCQLDKFASVFGMTLHELINF